MPRPLPDRMQKPRVSMCVDRLHPGSCLLVGSLASCAVWSATVFHKRWLWTMTTILLSEFLPQRRNRPMKRPLSCISGITFQDISLRNNQYSEVAILLFLCICQFRCKPTTHVVIHVDQMMRCTEENATLYWSIVDGLDPAGTTPDNTAQCLCLVVCSYAWESSFKAQIIHHCSLIRSQGTHPKDWPVEDFNEHSIIKLFHFATPQWNGTTLYIFMGNRHQLL